MVSGYEGVTNLILTLRSKLRFQYTLGLDILTANAQWFNFQEG